MTNAETLIIGQDEENLENMYLIFNVKEEAYGVSIGVVTEIVGMQRIVEVPDVPAYIKGVINLRGQVIPVMDVRLRFAMPEQAYDDRTVIIVLEDNDIKTGLIVDGVSDVQELVDEDVSPPPRKELSNDKGLIKGIGQTDDQVYFLLDVEKLLYTKTV